MKKHSLNLLIVSLIYLVVFIAVVVVSMISDIGIMFYNDSEEVDPDTMIFIASVFFTVLASYVVYLAFFLIQRNKLKNDPNAKFLGLGPRIVGAIVAVAVSFGVLFLCTNWTSDYGEIESILFINFTLLAVIEGITAVTDFVNFIVFKPRV
jgi:ABC-type cobalt transport system substrate-binding protein